MRGVLRRGLSFLVLAVPVPRRGRERGIGRWRDGGWKDVVARELDGVRGRMVGDVRVLGVVILEGVHGGGARRAQALGGKERSGNAVL